MGIKKDLRINNEISGNAREMKEIVIDRKAVANKMLAVMIKARVVLKGTETDTRTHRSYQEQLKIAAIDEVVKKLCSVKLSGNRFRNVSSRIEYIN
jgi:hypothetical protein